jgi:hypothetical protein
MKASRAAVKQAKAVTSLEAKVDLILAHLGIVVPEPEEPAPAEVAEPTPDQYAAVEADINPDASQRSQLEENRGRIGSRGKPAAARKTAKPHAK